jgi:hypothetical protein
MRCHYWNVFCLVLIALCADLFSLGMLGAVAAQESPPHSATSGALAAFRSCAIDHVRAVSWGKPGRFSAIEGGLGGACGTHLGEARSELVKSGKSQARADQAVRAFYARIRPALRAAYESALADATKRKSVATAAVRPPIGPAQADDEEDSEEAMPAPLAEDQAIKPAGAGPRQMDKSPVSTSINPTPARRRSSDPTATPNQESPAVGSTGSLNAPVADRPVSASRMGDRGGKVALAQPGKDRKPGASATAGSASPTLKIAVPLPRPAAEPVLPTARDRGLGPMLARVPSAVDTRASGNVADMPLSPAGKAAAPYQQQSADDVVSAFPPVEPAQGAPPDVDTGMTKGRDGYAIHNPGTLAPSGGNALLAVAPNQTLESDPPGSSSSSPSKQLASVVQWQAPGLTDPRMDLRFGDAVEAAAVRPAAAPSSARQDQHVGTSQPDAAPLADAGGLAIGNSVPSPVSASVNATTAEAGSRQPAKAVGADREAVLQRHRNCIVREVEALQNQILAGFEKMVEEVQERCADVEADRMAIETPGGGTADADKTRKLIGLMTRLDIIITVQRHWLALPPEGAR